MPLLDYFHPPLEGRRNWEAFHARWATAIADALNGTLLPARYFAESQSHVGSRVEIDVATLDGRREPRPDSHEGGGGTAVLAAVAPPPVYAPPAPAFVLPAIFPDSLEVLVYSAEAGPVLVAAVELVSPGNKDRPDTRRAFAAKCATYLREGVGVMVVDVVTNRLANLHNELVVLLIAGDGPGVPPAGAVLPAGPLYAASYRPARTDPRAARPGVPADRVEVWTAPVAVGRPLPLLPLPLDKGQFVPVDLEAAYTEARQRSRLG